MADGATQNKMGTEKVSRLVLFTGIPLMLSLLINSLYNFVDSVFVSRIAENALTALSMAAPVQTLMSALGLGNAVGLNAVISKALGAEDQKRVKKAASASLFLAVLAWVLIVLMEIFLLKPYFLWQSGDNEEIYQYGVAYLRICMIGSLGTMGQWVFDRFVMASGKSHLFLFTLSAASVTNLILDPIFIFGYLGLPAMGTAGAAIATVIGQWVGCFAGYFINRRWNREIPIHFSLKPDKDCVLSILKVGIPSTLVQVVVSFLTVYVNSVLIVFSNTAVAVYGACAKLQNLVTVGAHGINNGLIPIAAYNYGAKRADRIKASVRWAIWYSLILYAPFLLIMEFAPGWVLALFDASPEMLEIGIPALRILAVSWMLSLFCLVFAAGFQGLSMGLHSMALTLSRQVVLPVLLITVFARMGSLPLLWAAFVLAETILLPVGFLFWKAKAGKTLKALSDLGREADQE